MSQRLVDLFIKKYGRLPTELDPDYLEILRMSKYRILAIPDVKPGKCANCGSAKNDGRMYIDFDLQIDWYGVVFVCGFCLKDITNAMKLFQPYIDEIGRLKAELLSIKIEHKKGTDLEERFLHTFGEVKDYFDSLRSVSNDMPPDSSSDMGDESGSDKSKSGSDEPKPRVTKSNSSQRSSDLPSLAKLLELAPE